MNEYKDRIFKPYCNDRGIPTPIPRKPTPLINADRMKKMILHPSIQCMISQEDTTTYDKQSQDDQNQV